MSFAVNQGTATPDPAQMRTNGGAVTGASAEATGSLAQTEDTGKPKNPDTERFSEIARKERALRAMQRSIQEERAALKAQESRYKSDYIPKSKIAEDPMAVLTEAGYTAEQIAQILLQQQNPNDPLYTVQRELKKLQENQERTRLDAEEEQKKQADAARKYLLREAKLLVDGNEEFEAIKASEAYDAVIEYYDQMERSDEGPITLQEAAKEIENYLVEEFSKYQGLKKLQPKSPPAAEAAQKNPENAQGMTTLSNRVSPSTKRSSSFAEAKARAMAVAEGKLVT